jgi:hypothetical protein
VQLPSDSPVIADALTGRCLEMDVCISANYITTVVRVRFEVSARQRLYTSRYVILAASYDNFQIVTESRIRHSDWLLTRWPSFDSRQGKDFLLSLVSEAQTVSYPMVEAVDFAGGKVAGE